MGGKEGVCVEERGSRDRERGRVPFGRERERESREREYTMYIGKGICWAN